MLLFAVRNKFIESCRRLDAAEFYIGQLVSAVSLYI